MRDIVFYEGRGVAVENTSTVQCDDGTCASADTSVSLRNKMRSAASKLKNKLEARKAGRLSTTEGIN